MTKSEVIVLQVCCMRVLCKKCLYIISFLDMYKAVQLTVVMLLFLGISGVSYGLLGLFSSNKELLILDSS